MKNTKRDTPLRGPRPNSGGRPPKPDRDLYAKVTVHLKKQTIAQLKKGGGQYFGQFLQDHLDRYPLPSREAYEAYVWRQELEEEKRKAAVVKVVKPMSKGDKALKAWGKELTRKLLKEFGHKNHDRTRRSNH